MRGAGGQLETSVANGAKEMLQSAAVRDDALGMIGGYPRVVVSFATGSQS